MILAYLALLQLENIRVQQVFRFFVNVSETAAAQVVLRGHDLEHDRKHARVGRHPDHCPVAAALREVFAAKRDPAAAYIEDPELFTVDL